MRRRVRVRVRTVVVGVGVGALLLGGCDGSDGMHRLDPDVGFVGVADDAAGSQDMEAASVRLASRLVALVAADEDAVVSPVSLQLALALLREGASGRVAEEIDAAAGLDGDSQAVADLRALLATYEGDVAGIDPDDPPAVPILHIADSVFVQAGFDVEQTFLDRVGAFHGAHTYEVDFAEGDPKPQLDAWVARQTGRRLEQAPAKISPLTRMGLMDAVTFGATWRSTFPESGTYDEAFTRADGSEVDVPMMHQLISTGYASGDTWVAAELPYTEGFAMRVVLPDGAAVTEEDWLAAHAALDRAGVETFELTMPSWTTDTTLDLTDALETLGLGSLATPAGGLDGVFADAFVSSVAQGATITVAEQGTVAAAVTATSMEAGAAPVLPELELVLDRPFEYQVVEQSTGLVLFAGRVADPS